MPGRHAVALGETADAPPLSLRAWDLSLAAASAYTPSVLWSNGSTSVLSHREEPKLLHEFDEEAGMYVPTHLFNAAVLGGRVLAPEGGWKLMNSWVHAQPLNVSMNRRRAARTTPR